MATPNLNFNEILKEVNQFVTVKERADTTNCYNALVKTLINEMKKEDFLFNRLFNGVKLAGSYADGLKVSKADEYDTNLILKFPMDYANQVVVKEADIKHGYITINIQKGLDVLQKSSCNDHNKLLLAGFFDKEGYLLQDKVKAWMHSVLQLVLNKLQRNGSEYIIQADSYNCYIKDTQSGPALTLNVRVPSNSKVNVFSLDLVVAFTFDRKQWLSKREPPSHIKNLQWLGVPKPDKKVRNDNRHFVSSYSQIERTYLDGKNSLKNLIRLFKKIRDNKNIANLKSYYIKMMFLWVVENNGDSYWNRHLGVVFLEMFDVILKHLNEGKLLFFWDTRQNLFGDFKPQQLKSMHDQLLAEKNKIVKAIENKERNKILDVFLNDVEKQAIQKESGGCTNGNAAPIVRTTQTVRPTQTNRPAVPVIVATLETPLAQDKKQCIISKIRVK